MIEQGSQSYYLGIRKNNETGFQLWHVAVRESF